MRSSFLRWTICGWILMVSVIAFGQFDLTLGKNKAAVSADPKITVTTEPAAPKTGDVLTLKVDVKVPAGSYTYSMKEGFSGRTKVDLKTTAGVEAVDKEFSVNQKPKLKEHPATDKPVETLEGHVVWTRKYKVVDAAAFELTGSLKIQVCDDNSCRPLTHKIELGGQGRGSTEPKFVANYAPPERTAEGERPGPAEWTVKLSPVNAAPGESVLLEVTAKIKPGFHIFDLTQNPKNLGKPTVIDPQSLNGLAADSAKVSFKSSREPELHSAEGKQQKIHHDGVTFSRTFQVAPDAKPGAYGVAGLVSYQICMEGNCRTGKFEFAVGTVTPKKVVVVATPGAGNSSTTNNAGGDSALSQLLIDLKYINFGNVNADRTETSLALYLFYAFLGGMILNVMPCVLPVIAIKALGFVQQAGENRRRILALNASYSAGVIAVFVLLASLAAFAGLAWGGLFQKVGFNIAMCVLVFAMGLSLLGVFEIPVPGMVGSAAGAQHKEGLTGAFFTGIFATVLATPCSGPFLGTTLGWSVKQSVPVIYLVWVMIGVGMSFPYLVFGLFPKAIKMLPKPGNWMVTFKQLAGFCLLGTAVYLLTVLGERYVLPTVIMLLGIGFGLWMIGNLYDYSSTSQRRWTVRVSSFVVMGGISYFGFNAYEEKIQWEKFQPSTLAASLKEGRPVMVDFTADWCLTCKVVERTTLNTNETKDLVDKYGIVPLRADWTNEDADIEALLHKFDANSIPVLAVFSPSNPKEPIILRDAWSKSTLLEVLEQAAGNKGFISSSTSSAAASRGVTRPSSPSGLTSLVLP